MCRLHVSFRSQRGLSSLECEQLLVWRITEGGGGVSDGRGTRTQGRPRAACASPPPVISKRGHVREGEKEVRLEETEADLQDPGRKERFGTCVLMARSS